MNDAQIKTAYLAMYHFLDQYYQMTKSDDVGSLLGDMSLLQDGRPADAAYWNDWLEAVKKAEAGTVDASLKLEKHE